MLPTPLFCNAEESQNEMAVANAMLLGQTGAGKSTVGQAFIEHFGHRGRVFEASDGIDAHTQAPKSITVAGIKITDTPGLMDTMGRAKDIVNMELIVKTVRFLQHTLRGLATLLYCFT
jgi:predicted GTPase